MKSFRSSSPQSNRSTTSSAPRRRSCNAPMFTMSERAVDALLAQELIVALNSLDSRRRKRFGMHHTHLKLTCFLSKKNRCLFYWFRHSLPPDLTVTKILYTNPSLKARGGNDLLRGRCAAPPRLFLSPPETAVHAYVRRTVPLSTNHGVANVSHSKLTVAHRPLTEI